MLRLTLILLLGGLCQAAGDRGIAGEWEGESVCTGVRSACVNEHVIWTFRSPDRNGRVQSSADKVVNGERQNMGSGEFQPEGDAFVWKIPLGTWKFTVKHDTIDGILALNDGQVARNVSLKRVKR